MSDHTAGPLDHSLSPLDPEPASCLGPYNKVQPYLLTYPEYFLKHHEFETWRSKMSGFTIIGCPGIYTVQGAGAGFIQRLSKKLNEIF